MTTDCKTIRVADGASARSRIMALQSEHQAIIRDALAAADFWGGTRSLVWKQFMADLGRNFSMIYGRRDAGQAQPLVPASVTAVPGWRAASC